MTQKKSILIIDDDKFLLDMYATKFKESGFGVKTAIHTSDALAFLKDESSSFDVILLDLVMPAVDGYGLLKQICDAKLAEGVVKIVLSNLGEPQDIEKAKQLGADGYIIKASSTPGEVVERVREIMEK